MRRILLAVLISVICNFSSARTRETILDQIMTPETLGVQKAYLERLIGIPKRRQGNTYQYDIKKCLVNITYDDENSAVTVELKAISRRCSFDSAQLYLSGPIQNITFTQLKKISPNWFATEGCLLGCGLTPPIYKAVYHLSHAYDFLDISASSVDLDAQFRLIDALKIKYPAVDFVNPEYLGKTVPPEVYNQLWFDAFKSVKIESIKFGYNIRD